MRVTLKFDGCTTEQLRAILATCSKERDAFPPVSLLSTKSWMPQVACEGPECFGVVVAPVDSVTARTILEAAEFRA